MYLWPPPSGRTWLWQRGCLLLLCMGGFTCLCVHTHGPCLLSGERRACLLAGLQDCKQMDLITYVLSRSCMNCRHMLSMPGSRERRSCLLASAGNGRKLHVFMPSSTEATRHGTTNKAESKMGFHRCAHHQSISRRRTALTCSIWTRRWCFT